MLYFDGCQKVMHDFIICSKVKLIIKYENATFFSILIQNKCNE